MTLLDGLLLFLVMLALAALPSASVAVVVTRAATHGTASGVAAGAGIVTADLCFVLLAVLGLAVVAESLGGAFTLVRYAGALYLMALGFRLLRARAEAPSARRSASGPGHLPASFLAGFALTLGDLKALLFYASLFPVLVDIPSLGSLDLVAIVGITIASVGGAKVAYACAASHLAASLLPGRWRHRVRRLAGGGLMALGGYLLIKA